MATIIQSYDLVGDYILNGIKGLQKGIVHYLSNRLLVGFVQDDNSSTGDYTPEKLLLGMHDREKDELCILKISPGYGRKPVSWWLFAQKSLRRNCLQESYQGYYLFHPNISPAYLIGESIENGMPTLDELVTALDPIMLASIYFTPENIAVIQKQEQFPQYGSMRFLQK